MQVFQFYMYNRCYMIHRSLEDFFFLMRTLNLEKLFLYFWYVKWIPIILPGFLCLSEQVLPFLVLRLLAEVASFVAEHLL